MSSLSVRFFNSYKSKYLNFFFYLFDCQVSFALIGFSFLHHRVLYVRLRCTSLDLGSALCAVVGLDGLEPSTSRLSGARSSHLSYRPVYSKAYSGRSIFKASPWWWRWWDSNPWPPACRAGALPTELHPHWCVYVLLFWMNIEEFDNPSKLNNKRRCTRISSSLVKILL